MKLCENQSLITKEKWYITVALCTVAVLVVLLLYVIANRGSGYHEPMMEIHPNNTYEKTLRVAAVQDSDPYSFYNKAGELHGFDIELMYALANTMQVNVEIQLLSLTEGQAALAAGDIDVLLSAGSSGTSFAYTMPVAEEQMVCFGKQDFFAIEDLSDKRIAVLDGTNIYANLLDLCQIEHEAKTYQTSTAAFQSVIDGENDYVICRKSVGRRKVAQFGELSIGSRGPALMTDAMRYAVNRDQLMLVQKINYAMHVLTANGTMALLKEKWLGNYVQITQLQDYFMVHRELFLGIGIMIFAVICLTFFRCYREKTRYIQKQFELTTRTLEYERLLNEVTRGLYDSIYEADITHDRPQAALQKYLRSFGAPESISYTQTVEWMAEHRVKAEHAQGYRDMFERENVIKAYRKGKTKLHYEMLYTEDGTTYFWMRITGRIFFWQTDKSIRLIAYHQNIDAEKRREAELTERAQRDGMSGLYNKTTTERLIRRYLEEKKYGEGISALLMVDVDEFKRMNDSFGHVFGDYIICEYASTLRSAVAPDDIVGRVGGDEFLVFIKDISGYEQLVVLLEELVVKLNRAITLNASSGRTSASIGVALTPPLEADFTELYKKADAALYETKRHGKNGYTIYSA